MIIVMWIFGLKMKFLLKMRGYTKLIVEPDMEEILCMLLKLKLIQEMMFVEANAGEPEIFDLSLTGPDADYFELSATTSNDTTSQQWIYLKDQFDYEQPLDADKNNIYEVTINAALSDGIGSTSISLPVINKHEIINEIISFEINTSTNILTFKAKINDVPSNSSKIKIYITGPSFPTGLGGLELEFDYSGDIEIYEKEVDLDSVLGNF